MDVQIAALIEQLIADRDRLKSDVISMSGEIAGLERAIVLLQENLHPEPQKGMKSARGEAKTVLLDMLEEVGPAGLNASIAENLAKRKGVVLKRGTAASNLSRLKASGSICRDGDRYRLPKYNRQPDLVVVSGGAS